MIRTTLSASLLLCLLALSARAADPSPYAATAQATRSEDKITVSIQLTQHKILNVPPRGPTDVTATLASPQILLLIGQRAQITVGNGPQPKSPSPDITSGYQVEVISTKGKDTLLMVTTLIENSSVIWADVSTILITPQNPQKLQNNG